MFVLMLPAALGPNDVNVGQILDDTLSYLHIPIKHAAADCDVPEDTLRKALKNERPLDLWWMQRLGWRVWSEFTVRFLSAKTKSFVAEITEDLKRRAS